MAVGDAALARVVPSAMATALPRSFDPYIEASFDPFEDNMGEGSLQRFLSEELRPEIDRLLRERGTPTFVGADQYVGWHPDDRRKVVAPDVYLLPGVPPAEDFDFWKVWQTGVVPSFALEIVSSRKGKDYVDAPQRYAELGVEELIIFDPRHGSRRAGVAWQVYRRVPGRGFVRVEATSDDRVRSQILGCWLRTVGAGKLLRIRLAADPRGDAIRPTIVEAEQAERGRADAAEASVKTAQAETRAAQARAEAAEAELARLRAALAGGEATSPTRRR